MAEKFKADPLYVVPVGASLLFGAICALLVIHAPMQLYEITPLPEGIGSIGNAVYFVVLVGFGATLIYLLLKRRNFRLITIITGFALTAAIFMLSMIYLFALFSILTIPYSEALTVALSVLITALADFEIFSRRGKISDGAILCVGGGLGTFLGFSVPTISAISILGFLAVYDAIAVYRGPVGKIARNGLEQLHGLSFAFKDVQMGLGDLTFYSMLTSRVLFDAGPFFWSASTIGVLIGAFISFKMLERKGIFPGLPFPTVLGLIPLIVSIVFR